MSLRNPLVRGLIVHEPAVVFFCDLLRLLLQSLKIAPILPVVDLLIQGKKVRVPVGDIVHDGLLEPAAEVQIFKPHEVALILRPLYDRLNIRKARKYRRNETHRPDPRVIDLLHRRKPPLDTHRGIHVVLKGLIQRVD